MKWFGMPMITALQYVFYVPVITAFCVYCIYGVRAIKFRIAFGSLSMWGNLNI